MALFRVKSLILFVIIMACMILSCSNSEEEDPLEDFRGFWQNENKLFYLDLTNKGKAAFVLPKKAATITSKKKAKYDGKRLFFGANPVIVLHVEDPPKLFGHPRCMVVEDTRLCESSR